MSSTRTYETYYLRTFGCQMNEHDSERIAGLLAGMGLRPVDGPQRGDVLVYNTCSIREKADTRLTGHLGEARRLKAEDRRRLVIVAGCLAQSRQEGFFQQFPFVDVLVGPQSLHELPLLIEERLETGRHAGSFQRRTTVWSADLPRVRRTGPSAWVQIMTGCSNYCTYCIVPHVRGPEASRPAADIAREVRELAAAGVREVTLLGQNVNAYGREPGFAGAEDFPALLEALADVSGIERIRFMTSHPKDVSPRLLEAMAELAPVCEHLHLPLQSGSDRILAAMRRRYDRATYLDLVGRLRSRLPGLALTTDIIVGFPSETEADFADTLSLLEEVGHDGAFTFIYSPRRGTKAASLPGQLPREVTEERLARLVALAQRLATDRNQKLVGTVEEILVEGRSKNDSSMVKGRTRTHKTVNVPGDFPPGELVQVLIRSASSTSLVGVAVP
ncbi:MAG: tRNA (N6-isopentenyl adenosine(37)-C2)-methylthiotransferase MiaB [Thermoleophilia bacterium]|nr:tRNA (N6-isopentenyl adenosine(37)-C2)-methylthiotransferase MiaB [Thermoleophilia bacterium]